MIEIANDTLSSSVTLTTSGSDMDAQFPDYLKTKIEETTGETIQMVIATSSNPSSFNLLFICPSSIHLHHH